MASRPLVFLGGISYALYLIHEFIGYAIIRALEDVGLSRLLATLTAAATAFALAVLITKFVDEPLRAPLRKLLAGRPSLRGVAAGRTAITEG